MRRRFTRPSVVFLIVVVSMVVLSTAAAGIDKPTSFRLRYMGSSCFSSPTGSVSSEMAYIVDDGHNMTLIAQPVYGKFAELSMLRHMNGDTSNKSVMNLKVNILEEGTYLPNVVWGVSDFNTQLGSKIFYFAATKTIDYFTATLHAGYYKDPVTTRKKLFFGAEKVILPLVVVAGDRIDDKTTIGMKFRPYPGVSIDYARRIDAATDQTNIYKISYLRSF